MSNKERIFHMILFEVVALALLTVFAMLITGNATLSMGGLAISLSLIAMAWNYTYNLGYDTVFGHNRETRTLINRVLHGFGFEAGMIILSFPVIMWILKLNFIAVFWMDMIFVLFFFFYAITFNWLYDISRKAFLNHRSALS